MFRVKDSEEPREPKKLSSSLPLALGPPFDNPPVDKQEATGKENTSSKAETSSECQALQTDGGSSAMRRSSGKLESEEARVRALATDDKDEGVKTVEEEAVNKKWNKDCEKEDLADKKLAEEKFPEETGGA